MITLAQLYDLGNNVNIDIFSGLSLPDGSPLDRDTIINSIIEKCGLNIPMYADPRIMQSAVTLWSAKNQYTFIHVGKIYNAEYSPIENTDRYDEIIVERDLTDDTTINSTKTEDGETTNNNTNAHTGTDTTTVEETTSAENVSDYQPKDETKSTAVFGSTISDNGGSTIDKTTKTDGTNNKTVDENTKTTQHLHGNIGTTTNTMLQTEEYNLLEKYNPYDFIAGLFENSLTLLVY